MREIQFRVIDAKTKKVIGHETWDISFGWCFVILPDDTVRAGTFPDGLDRHIRNQFTGLRDKNDDQIFDGDRVKQRITDFENGGFIDMFYEVRWAKWCYGLYIADKWMATLDTPKANSIEVVGNIFDD